MQSLRDCGAAKKHTGLSESHKLFWDWLAALILERQVRVLAGDFNMSLWVVARELRGRGLQVNFAGAFAWTCDVSAAARSDSCGIFVVGPSFPCARMWTPRAFGSATPALAGELELQRFVKGQGYPLTSYLPKG